MPMSSQLWINRTICQIFGVLSGAAGLRAVKCAKQILLVRKFLIKRYSTFCNIFSLLELFIILVTHFLVLWACKQKIRISEITFPYFTNSWFIPHRFRCWVGDVNCYEKECCEEQSPDEEHHEREDFERKFMTFDKEKFWNGKASENQHWNRKDHPRQKLHVEDHMELKLERKQEQVRLLKLVACCKMYDIAMRQPERKRKEKCMIIGEFLSFL